jgi:Raf kinase inhibitor-like YbhB/YbcL family protein
MASKRAVFYLAAGVSALALLVVGAVWALHGQSVGDIPARATLQMSSTSFADGTTMPARLTCDGPDISPNLQWSAPPAGTKSYAIAVNDPDAPFGFTHWLAYNLPPDLQSLPEGASTPSKRLDHAAEGRNGFGNIGYGGPCPPAGKPHHYVFSVYALDVDPALPAGQGPSQLVTAIQAHVLAKGIITGLYGRNG